MTSLLFFTYTHSNNSLVPTLNNFSNTNLYTKGLICSIWRVKNRTIKWIQSSMIIYRDMIASLYFSLTISWSSNSFNLESTLLSNTGWNRFDFCGWHVKRKVVWYVTKLRILEYSRNLFLIFFWSTKLRLPNSAQRSEGHFWIIFKKYF